MDDAEDYFWRKPTEYHSFYSLKILGYLDITCCIVVVISNISIILVLTRKTMISPINTIFNHISITESLAALSYSARAWNEYFRVEKCSISKHRTFIWESISTYCYIVAFLFRHVGVWMAVMLAVWRYIAVLHPLKERDWCNMKITHVWIVVGYIFSVFISIIPFFSVQVGPVVKLLDQNGCSTSNFTIGQNVTIYEFQMPLENFPIIYHISFAFYGIFIKILPSVAFGVIIYRLILSLIKAKNDREAMFGAKRNDTYNRIKQRLTHQTDRTTKFLILILMLFVIGEVPHGILCIFTVFYGPKFFWKYYYYGMEFCNCLTHISESFNFILYYSMSSQFRKTFKTLFTIGGKAPHNSQLSTQLSNSSLSGINKTSNNINRSSSINTISSTSTYVL